MTDNKCLDGAYKYELTIEEDIMNDEYSFYINGVQVSEELSSALIDFIPKHFDVTTHFGFGFDENGDTCVEEYSMRTVKEQKGYGE